MNESHPTRGDSREGRRFSPDLAIVLLVLIWGSNFSVVKPALSEFSPLAFNSTRFVNPPSRVMRSCRRELEWFLRQDGWWSQFPIGAA